MKNFLLLFVALVLLFSCKKDKSKISSFPDGKYLLQSVISDVAIDVNYDGVVNQDLKKEIPALNDIAMYVKNNLGNNVNNSINIIWVEPRLNDGLLYTPLPLIYNSSLKIEYVPVDNSYYFDLSESMDKLKIGSKLVNDNGEHTLSDPIFLEYNSHEDLIKFKGQQKFLTQTGIVTYFFTAIYHRDKNYISP